MERIKKINGKNLPSNPIGIIKTAILLYLLFDKLNMPQWVFVAVGTFILFLLIGSLISIYYEDHIDIFKHKDRENK